MLRSNGVSFWRTLEYHAAKKKTSFIEGRVAEIESIIAQAELIDVSKLSGTVVKFGATVSIINLDNDKESKYQLVGEVEADIEQKKISVTASVDNITFKSPIFKGDIVTITAFITRVFNTSMEIFIEVQLSKTANLKKSVISNSAFFTFVTLNEKRKPVKSIEVKPNTEEEKKLFNGALRRRQLRLILAGKMKPEEADELKSIFN